MLFLLLVDGGNDVSPWGSPRLGAGVGKSQFPNHIYWYLKISFHTVYFLLRESRRTSRNRGSETVFFFKERNVKPEGKIKREVIAERET